MDHPQEAVVSSVGLTVLNPELSPDNAFVDIVFVHGLGGHARGTWEYRGPNKDPVSHVSQGKAVDRPSINESIGQSDTQEPQEEGEDGAPEVPAKRHFFRHLKNIITRSLSPSSRIKGKAKEKTERTSSNDNVAKKAAAKANVFFWPQNLPEACTRARVMTFGYDSDVSKFFGGAANRNTFYDHAGDLLGALVRKRTRAQDRPIIFVAHSLGGLVVKQMLFEADRTEAFPQRRKIYLSTRALFFLGTPHRGSDWTGWGEIARSLAGLIFDTNPSLIKHLRVNGEPLMQLEKHFGSLVYRRTFWVYTFMEAKGFKPLPFLNSKIVNDNYAIIGDQGREQIFTINANHTAMCRFCGRDDPGYEIVAGELNNCVRETIVQADVDETRLKEVEENSRQEALLKSLDYEGRRNREDQLWEIRANIQTIEWVWRSSFADWASGAGGFFWICGKPGSGKSTLMEHIARSDKLQDNLRRGISERWTIIRHFFFGFGVSKDIRNNFEGFLRSLLYQLIGESSEADNNLEAVDLPGNEREQQWSMRALQERLAIVLNQRRNPICILVDGVDEYQDSKWDLAHLLREMASSRVKLCVASRPDRVLNVAFEHLPTIKMQEWNTPGIDKMVTLSIQRDVAESGFYNDNEVVQLAEEISNKAQGVFLWARFAVKELRDGWSKGLDLAELQMRLEKAPEELEDIYARIFRQLEPKQKQEAAYLLQLVCYAKRTLTLDELYVALAHATGGQGPFAKGMTALAIQKFEKRLLAATGGVLEVFRGREPYDSQESDDSESYVSQESSYAKPKNSQKSVLELDESQETDDQEPYETHERVNWVSHEGQETDKLYVNVIHRTVRTYLDSNGWSQLLTVAHEGMLHAEVLWLRVCAANFPPSFKGIPSFQELPKSLRHESMLGRVRAALDPTDPLSPDGQLSPAKPLDSDQRSDGGDKILPLLEYAAMYMLHYAADVEQDLGLASYDMLQPGISNSFMCYHRFYCVIHRTGCTCFQHGPDPLHPLHLAIAHGLDGYVKDFLLSRYDDIEPGSREWDDLFYLEVDKTFGAFSARALDSFRMSLLEFAIHHASKLDCNHASQNRIVALLLELYPHVSDVEMILALKNASAEVVKLLLRHWPDGKMVLKSNPFTSNYYLKQEISVCGLLEFCSESLDIGPMWYIARRRFTYTPEDNAKLINLFLQRGENINDQCGPLGTALHGAVLKLSCMPYRLGIWKLLVAKGANINAGGPPGTPLEFMWRLANTVTPWSNGCIRDWRIGIHWLIENGAVNNRCDPNGSVPSRERMLAFGQSGKNGVLESQRLYRGDPIEDQTVRDSTDAEVGRESDDSDEREKDSSSDS